MWPRSSTVLAATITSGRVPASVSVTFGPRTNEPTDQTAKVSLWIKFVSGTGAAAPIVIVRAVVSSTESVAIVTFGAVSEYTGWMCVGANTTPASGRSRGASVPASASASESPPPSVAAASRPGSATSLVPPSPIGASASGSMRPTASSPQPGIAEAKPRAATSPTTKSPLRTGKI